MELKTLTWSNFDQHRPCYSPAERYGEWSGTILDLLRRQDIPAADRIWAATRRGIVDDKTLRLFACKCVREVWHLLTDERSRKAVEVAERHAVGEATDEELAAARAASAAARDAARDSARDAAWSAARAAASAASAAARAAARDAARDAAWAAERAAARDAARDSAGAAERAAMAAALDSARDAAGAAWAAARERQIQILIELIQH